MLKTFNTGDIAVYPAHGVGVIENVEKKNILGKEQSFLIMRIFDNDMTIMVPTENIGKVGIRELINKDQITQVFDILREKSPQLDGKTWNKRFREYSEKIKVGQPNDIAEVMRDLMNLKNEKGLSFGERKMLDNVKHLLSQEIALATNDQVDTVLNNITKVFDN
ncbi:MAG: CarD family transcriptional regulator [Deltaproteobacteria bacterium]|nr:CarD family transcriptional regulator [Deltaproteobacteria bacterium]